MQRPSFRHRTLGSTSHGFRKARRVVTEFVDNTENKTERQFARFKTKAPLQMGTIVYLYRPALDKLGHETPEAYLHRALYYCCEKPDGSANRLREFYTNRLVKAPVHLNHFQPVLLRDHHAPILQWYSTEFWPVYAPFSLWSGWNRLRDSDLRLMDNMDSPGELQTASKTTDYSYLTVMIRLLM